MNEFFAPDLHLKTSNYFNVPISLAPVTEALCCASTAELGEGQESWW